MALVVAAQSLRVELAIAFMWRPREGAAHPGKKARLNVPSTAVWELNGSSVVHLFLPWFWY